MAAFFTFLPSFIFILVGGTLVESTRDNVQLTAPLTGISAAVVWVVASLALFFGQHVFQLSAQPAQWDWVDIGISLGAVGLGALTGFAYLVDPQEAREVEDAMYNAKLASGALDGLS